MVVDTRPQKIAVFNIHDATEFDADSAILNGSTHKVSENNSVWVWFESDSYDGTVYFEVSPNGGDHWFPIQGFELNDFSTLVVSVASPADADSYVIRVPTYSTVRIRMSGGTTGTLSVYLRNVDWSY